MLSSQVARSSFVNVNPDGQTVSGSINFVRLTVAIVDSRSFSDFVSIFVLSDVVSTPGSRAPLKGVPPRRHSRVNRVTPRSLKIYSLPLPALL